MSPLVLILFLPLVRESSSTFSLFLPQTVSQYLSEPQEAGRQQLGQQGHESSEEDVVPYQGPVQYSQPVLLEQQQQLQQSPQQQGYQQVQQVQQGQPLPLVYSHQHVQFGNQDHQPSGYYLQQEEGPSPGTEPEYDEDKLHGYRYQHSYQSSYRQQVNSVPYSTYQPHIQPPPPTVDYYHYQRPVVPSYQLPDAVPPAGLGDRLGGPVGSLPVYQLMTVGPEVPVLVRLPNQQTAILPVRTVYSLPGFLERIVQRVQNFYSVYNPLEVLQTPKSNDTDEATPTTTAAPATVTTTKKTVAVAVPVTTQPPAVEAQTTVLPAAAGKESGEVSPAVTSVAVDSTAEPAATTTDASNDIDGETTTVVAA